MTTGAKTVTAVVLARHNEGTTFEIDRLSSAGARLAGPLTLANGERIQLLLDIAGCPLDLHAEVVAVTRDSLLTDRIAVRFIDLDDTAAESIRAAIDNFPGLLGLDE